MLRLPGTNTYLIHPPQSTTCLLLDTGQGSAFPIWRRSVQQILASESGRLGKQVRITQCVLSHWHHDHVGGVNELRQVCNEVIQGSGGNVFEDGTEEKGTVRIYKYPLPDPSSLAMPPSPNRSHPETKRDSQLLRSANDNQDVGPIRSLHDGQILQVGEPNPPDGEALKLQVLHTPGHTSDHIALLITSSPADPEEVGTIFTGDAVLGHGTAIFEDLTQYMDSLEKMKVAIDNVSAGESSRGEAYSNRQRKNAARAFPGHGAVIPGAKAKIDEYIAHRMMRVREVTDLLAGDSSSRRQVQVGAAEARDDKIDGWTSMEIVKVVYKEVPETLHVAAERGVVQILTKLEREGRVEKCNERDGGRWRLVHSDHQMSGITNCGDFKEGKSSL